MSQKLSLVTGASRGFGGAMAEALAARGDHVIALARTVGALEELDDRIQAAGGKATLVPLDILDTEGLKRLCLSIYDRWGGLDLWLHTAIFAGPLAPADHLPQKDWDKALATNISATKTLIEMIAPLLRPRKGTALLPIESELVGQKFHAAHAASKAAQNALWQAFAAEQKNAGLAIKTITPAPMPTALRARFYPGENRSGLADPRDQAKAILSNLG